MGLRLTGNDRPLTFILNTDDAPTINMFIETSSNHIKHKA